MDRLFIYSVVLNNEIARVRDFLTRHGVDYLIATIGITERLKPTGNRILLTVRDGLVEKAEWG